MASVKHLDLSPHQLRALASERRLQIFSVLARHGPLSIADLADRLSAPASGLYHHMHRLMVAGLVEEARREASGRRHKQLYRAAARQISSAQALRTKPGRAAFAQAARRFLAAAEKGFADALLRGEGATEGARRDTMVRRIHVRLGARDLAQLNARIDGLIEEALAHSKDAGPGIELTVVMNPAASGPRRRN